MNESRFFLLGAAAAIPLILLVIIPHNAFAWGWGPGPGGWGAGVGDGGWYHQGAYQNGYYAGTQDAIYDHENNLVYTDQPSCLSCHSQLYLDGFKHGYSQEWNSYQAQNTDQRVNVYVNNSPGAEVNVGQTSTQGQDGSIGPGGQDGDYGP